MPIDTRGLTLYAYTLPTTGSPSIRVYDTQVDALRFTTLAPGGYGDLSCRLSVPNARNVPPELRLMSNVALMGAGFPAFLGRWEEPGVALDPQQGDILELTAQGAPSVLQDDPDNAAYTLQTGYSIITGELSRRSVYLPISSDYSLILPNNPSVQLSPAFDGKTVEDELNELAPVLGDYQWLVWGHAAQTDAGGFPTWQLQTHLTDRSTVAYLANTEDFQEYHVRPAMDYSYNVVQILYRDITTNQPSSVTVSDSRLGGGGAQGSAPFPRRKLRKDLSAYHLSATQATAMANALLAQYQSGGFKISVVLNRLFDAQGREVPLWMCRADTNIYIPDLAPVAGQLPTQPTSNNAAGATVFYVTETEYSEQEGQAPQLTLTCDSFYDKGAFQVARLQYREEHRIRSGKQRQPVSIPGEQWAGQTSVNWGANALANDIYGNGVVYGHLLTNTPSSITLTPIGTPVNVNTVSVSAITNRGFGLNVKVNANGAGGGYWSYTTVGA